MAGIIAEKVKTNTVSFRLKVDNGNNRQVTDKYWSLLFGVFLIILLTVGQDVIRYKPVCQTGLDITHTNSCKVTTNDNITVRKTIEHALHIWGKNWLFDAITCNVSFLDANYQRSGAIVIWAHLLACICLIAYSVASMRSDYSHRNQMITFGMIFVPCILFTRMKHVEDITSLYLLMPFSLPEIILLIVGWTKPDIPERCYKQSVADKHKRDVFVFNFSIPFVFLALVCYMLSGLRVFREIQNYELDWDRGWSYVVAGIICYMCLMLYYYVLMVISCATSLNYDWPLLYIFHKNFFRAWYIVARYHFGTLCYHATIIFPRLNATFVMNEREFRNTEFSVIRRFYLTHWMIHDLTLTATAVTGHNHSKSIREILRLLTSNLPERKNFQSYSQLFRVLSTLLISVNNLVFISLWIHGATFYPHSFMITWVTNLLGIFFAYLISKFFDPISDAVWLSYDGKVNIMA